MTSEHLDQLALGAGRDLWRASLLGDCDLALQGCVAARQVMQASVEFALLVRLPWRDAADVEAEPAAIRMRVACRKCGHVGGIVRLTRGQRVVSCAACASYAYCAPSAEVASWR